MNRKIGFILLLCCAYSRINASLPSPKAENTWQPSKEKSAKDNAEVSRLLGEITIELNAIQPNFMAMDQKLMKIYSILKAKDAQKMPYNTLKKIQEQAINYLASHLKLAHDYLFQLQIDTVEQRLHEEQEAFKEGSNYLVSAIDVASLSFIKDQLLLIPGESNEEQKYVLNQIVQHMDSFIRRLSQKVIENPKLYAFFATLVDTWQAIIRKLIGAHMLPAPRQFYVPLYEVYLSIKEHTKKIVDEEKSIALIRATKIQEKELSQADKPEFDPEIAFEMGKKMKSYLFKTLEKLKEKLNVDSIYDYLDDNDDSGIYYQETDFYNALVYLKEAIEVGSNIPVVYWQTKEGNHALEENKEIVQKIIRFIDSYIDQLTKGNKAYKSDRLSIFIDQITEQFELIKAQLISLSLIDCSARAPISYEELYGD